MPTEFSLPHLPLGAAHTERFKSPKAGRGNLRLPEREKQAHAAKLRADLDEIEAVLAGRDKAALVTMVGLADFDLKAKSAADKKTRTELLISGTGAGREPFAVVRMSKDGLRALERKVNQYETQLTKKGRPCNHDFLVGIESIRVADPSKLWVGSAEEWPRDEKTSVWWELWLLGGDLDPERADSALDQVIHEANARGIEIPPDRIRFPERQTVLAKASVHTLAALVEATDMVAEIHPPSRGSVQYFANRRHPIADLSDLTSRIVSAPPEAPRVALIDTGVNHQHPLLLPVVAPGGLHTIDDSSESTADYYYQDGIRRTHGTEVAGIAAYGDIAPVLAGGNRLEFSHSLESVRIPLGAAGTELLWGSTTARAVEKIERSASQTNRVFNMSIGGPPDQTPHGKPTSWSAAVDKICYNDGLGRLMTVAAGNAQRLDKLGYPARNMALEIVDPSHAANAICVGGVTELADAQPPLAGHEVLASLGGISPHSRSGVADRRIKPEILCEAGNALWGGSVCDTYYDGLSPMTTNADFPSNPLVNTCGTSMASAAAARMLALIWADNPNRRPATIRGLLVHSANWTEELRRQFPDKGDLRRVCGYGVPNLSAARRSARSAVTLIAEDQIDCGAIDRTQGGRRALEREMAVYHLPWPRDVLTELGSVMVELSVTLSFFAEPNPKQYATAYEGAMLAWDMKTPTETDAEFLQRVNQLKRNERTAGFTNTIEWSIGPLRRSRGTVQSDRWRCNAAVLATCDSIVVYPRFGWWKDNPRKRPDQVVPYSLIVSIASEDASIDLYVPIETAISVQIPAGS
jgi:hypothetical protein